MRDDNNIIHLGPILSFFDIQQNPFLSSASTKWQENWVQALLPLSKNYIIFSYLPNPYFPKGKITPKQKEYLNKTDYHIHYLKYINFIYLRELSLFISIVLEIYKLKYSPNILVTYNSSKHNILIGRLLNVFICRGS